MRTPHSPFRPRSATAGLLASLLLCATAVAFPADAQATLAPADSQAPTAALPVGSPEPGQAALPAQPAPAGLCAVTMRKALTSTLQTSGITSFGGMVSSSIELWQSGANRPLAPASVTKLRTASAALHALSPNRRQETGVYLAIDGSLVVRGTGDITLSRRATGPTFYRNAARLSDLARQVSDKVKLLPIKPKRLIVDTSYYTGPTMAYGWDRWDIGGGSIAPMAPAMLDGARIYDTGWYNSRTATPSLQLGATLAQFLNVRGLTVEVADSTPLALLPLGKVYSAPLTDRVHDMLLYSDNVLAESIGREVAKARAKPASFQGAASAVLAAVAANGIPTTGAVLHDTSGLSTYDRLTASTVAETLRPHTRVDKAQVTDIIAANLPVAGQSGTLRYRFGGQNAAARGHIRAKTGSLNNVSTLAGIVYSARTNTPYYFAFLVNNTAYWPATSLVDNLAAALYRTGC